MNPQNKKQIIALGALGVLLVGVIAYQFMGTGGGGSSAAKKPPAKPAAAGPTEGLTTLKIVDVNVDDLLKGIEVVTFQYERERVDRNVMGPLVGYMSRRGSGDPVGSRSMEEALRKSVTGIIFDEYSPAAVVDDEVVYPGYRYSSGVEVHRIERTQVIFKVGDSLVPVKMQDLGAVNAKEL